MPKGDGLIPFKKGQSGNPKGRPKGSGTKLRRVMLREMVCIEVSGDSALAHESKLRETYPQLFQDQDGTPCAATLEQMINARLVKIALTGKEHNAVSAIKEINDRLYGSVEKADQQQDATGGQLFDFARALTVQIPLTTSQDVTDEEEAQVEEIIEKIKKGQKDD